MKKLEPYTLLVGMQDGASSMENNTLVLQKIRNRITVCPSNSTAGCIPKEIESKVLKILVHPCSQQAYSQLVTQWKQSECHRGRMDKQNVVHPYDRMLFSRKRKEVLTPSTAGMDLADITLSGISQAQKDECCTALLI